MCKPEVKSLVALMRCGLNILRSLLLRHSTPYAIALPVLRDIVQLRCKEEHQSQYVDSNQSAVATVVVGLVFSPVDVRSDDVTRLY